MIANRVEHHILHKDSKYFDLILDLCHLSKNLYNHGNYVIRQELNKTGEWLRGTKLERVLRADTEYPDYRNVICSAQTILQRLDTDWKTFFALCKDYKVNSSKYTGPPKPPRYKPKDGYYSLIIYPTSRVWRKGMIRLPKVFRGFTIKPYFLDKPDFVSYQYAEFKVVNKNKIQIDLVYRVEEKEKLSDNRNYLSIDLGINNLATVATSSSKEAYMISGRPLKSINQYYNKQRAYYSSIAKRMNDKYSTNRLQQLATKRNNKVKDYLHKTSKKIIDICLGQQITKIVIGYNKDFQRNANLGKITNQHFCEIPFKQFINYITYKARQEGIAVVTTEESYTSGTSFVDNELPTKENYDISRRIHRGLFKSNQGLLINADLNAAYQIMKKVVPGFKWNRGCPLHPVVVTI